MQKLKTYILRFQALSLAFFVAMISSGFTYHWEVCTHNIQQMVCSDQTQSSCCCATNDTPIACNCSDMANNICDISFSKYVQFSFESLTSSNQNLVPVLFAFVETSIDTSSKAFTYFQKKETFRHSKAPPLCGRKLLCAFQTFLI